MAADDGGSFSYRFTRSSTREETLDFAVSAVLVDFGLSLAPGLPYDAMATCRMDVFADPRLAVTAAVILIGSSCYGSLLLSSYRLLTRGCVLGLFSMAVARLVLSEG